MNTIGYDFKDTYVSLGGLSVAVRLATVGNVYAPDNQLVRVERQQDGLVLTAGGLMAAGGQMRAPGRIELTLRALPDGGISVSGSACHPHEACRSMVLLVRGLPIERLVSESDNMPSFALTPHEDTPILSWPGRTATMPLVFIQGDGREFYALSRDGQARRKAFAAFTDHISGQPTLQLVHNEDRRHWNHTISLPAWEIGPCASRNRVIQRRFDDLERHFGLKPFEACPERAWVDDVRLIVNLHGQHWTGHVFMTFDQMAEALSFLCEHIDGEQLLAFLPAWDGRYYTCYPAWQPAEALGGEAGLTRLMARARELRVRVIPMLGGPNLATGEFLEREGLMDAVMKDADGLRVPQNWCDWDMDLSPEMGGWIVNWGHPGFQSRMVDLAVELIRKWGFAGVFLDGAIRWENAPDYSPYEGMHAWAQRVHEQCPEALLMGEDGYDLLWGDFGLFATSMQPLGLNQAMLRYTRQSYYLAYPAPGGSGGIHEQAWYSPTANCSLPEYTIPVLALVGDTLSDHRAEVLEAIQRAQRWSLKKPNWEE